mgnify:CR=1 FL=1
MGKKQLSIKVKEITIKLMVLNARGNDLIKQITEIKKIETKLKILLLEQQKDSDEAVKLLKLELLIEEAYNYSNSII